MATQNISFCHKAGKLWWKKFIFVYAFPAMMFDVHNFTVLPHKQKQKYHKTCALGLEIYLPFLILENTDSPTCEG
jgi:hypothetical protein